MLNVGLVGFGFAGKVFHAPVIRAVDRLRLTTIVQRLLSVYQNRRFVGDFVTLQQKLLKEDALGGLAIFESHFDRLRPGLKPNAWREELLPGSGVWFDLWRSLGGSGVNAFWYSTSDFGGHSYRARRRRGGGCF